MKTKFNTFKYLAALLSLTLALQAQAELCDDYWVEGGTGREIALDTRERIVVASPTEVLPIAYSTNNWDTLDADRVTLMVANKADPSNPIKAIVTNENGYLEWQPNLGDYGQYISACIWTKSGTYKGVSQTNIYYSTYFPLSWEESAAGTIAVTLDGSALSSPTNVLGYSYLNLTATPTYNGEERYEFEAWSATTNAVAYTAGFTNTATAVTRFEMPNSEATIGGSFTWKSKFAELVTVNEGESWNVYADDDYEQGITNNGTIVWKPGVTNKVGKAFYLADYSQLKNGQNGKLQIAFDSSLTNGTYTLAMDMHSVGTVFEITNGFDAKDCKVVDIGDVPTTDWVYVGSKRFKLCTNSDGTGELRLIVEPGIPMALDFIPAVEGGSFTVKTNGAAIASGEKVFPGDKVVLVFAPSNTQWQVNTNTLRLVDANSVTNGVSYFADVTLEGANFRMTETNATFSVGFAISEVYRKSLLQAAKTRYLAASNAIERLRENRLTQAETDDVLKNALGAFTAATNDLAAAYKPSEGDAATNTLTLAMADYEASAKARSDNKPWTITVNANATADGTNVFNTIDAAFAATDYLPYATNLVVLGEQISAVEMPAMTRTWNLIVTNWQAAATYDNTKSPYKQSRLVLGATTQTSQFLGKLAKVSGEGRILVDRTSGETAISFAAALNNKRPAGEKLEAIAAQQRQPVVNTLANGEYIGINMIGLANVTNVGKVAFSAPTVRLTGPMFWDLRNDNQLANLANFDDVYQVQGSSLNLLVDDIQSEGGMVTNYVIAGRANNRAEGATFGVYNGASKICDVVVGGATQYVRAKAYSAKLVEDGANAGVSNVVFTIAWGKFAITYEAMAGKWSDGSEQSVIDAYVNKGYEFPTVDPARDNYTFDGWFRSWTNGAEQVFATNIAASAVNPMEDHSLYAQWTPVSVDPSEKDIAIPDITNGVPVLAIGAYDYAQASHPSQAFETLVTPLYLQSIGKGAFQGVTTLKTLIITPSRSYADPRVPVTLTIGSKAFASCAALEEIRIPGEVTQIDGTAFANSAKLKRILFTGTSTITYGAKAFYRCGWDNGEGQLKVYMKQAFKDNNAQLLTDFQSWNTTLVITPLVDVSPIAGTAQIQSTDFGSLGSDRKVAILVKVPTLIPGTKPDVSSVVVKYTQSLGGEWSNLQPDFTEPSEDGTVLVEFTMPQGNSGFLKVEITE